MQPDDRFDALLEEGIGLDVEAYWGAGFLAGRYLPSPPPWTWRGIAAPHLRGAGSVLDMGTGDGGILLGLAPLPPLTVAYEEWLSTVPAAAATLRPAGVHLVVCAASAENTSPSDETGPGLPFADASFDVVLNRHECFDPQDVRRILRPDGMFVTQQVGHDESRSLRALLNLPTKPGQSSAQPPAIAQRGGFFSAVRTLLRRLVTSAGVHDRQGVRSSSNGSACRAGISDTPSIVSARAQRHPRRLQSPASDARRSVHRRRCAIGGPGEVLAADRLARVEYLDPTCRSAGSGEPPVGGQQDRVECFGERDVHRVPAAHGVA
ncbi:MAG TPA: hypothetical protein VFJ14_05570 [Nocardioidaceae bacterium]|nr:hypothetical protein [Nocardioidaceae bacterium]